MALHVDTENQMAAAGKGIVQRGMRRNALGTITNQCIKHVTVAAAKAVPQKQAVARVSRSSSTLTARDLRKTGLIRSSVLERLTKCSTNVLATKEVKKEPSVLQYGTPIPMDIDTLSTAFSAQLLPSNVEDIDADEESNIQLVSEYAPDIFAYLRFVENHFVIHEDFMKGQREITAKMRGILIDWLVQVHQRFHLLQETLYLTVACLDRYLQEQQVSKTQLQLVGVTAMYVASKYEMYAPDVGDFVYITDNAYSKQGIFKMEQCMLKVLRFGLGRPLPLNFLRRNSKAGNIDAVIHTIAKYLMELSLTEVEFCHWPPSRLAAAALCLSLRVMDEEGWGVQLAHCSGYTESEITPSVCQLARLVLKAPCAKLQAISLKYSTMKLLKVAVRPQLTSAIIKELAALATSSYHHNTQDKKRFCSS